MTPYIVMRLEDSSQIWRKTRTVCPMTDPMTETGAPRSATDISEMLHAAGLRPTRQRMALGLLMFGAGDRHFTAEMLHEEAVASGQRMSLATVYNTLHQFRRAGLLRELAIDGSKTHFDTNTSNHSHFFVERDGRVLDIPGSSLRIDGLPTPPEGMRISHDDVVVRLVKA